MDFGYHTNLGIMTVWKYRGSDPCPVVPAEINGQTVRRMEETFKECRFLRGAVLPETVDAIGEGVFLGCDALTEYVVPDNVVRIEDYAFCVCRHLKTIALPPSLTSIGRNAFYGCESLEEIDLSHVTWIGAGAFCGCLNLKRVVLGAGLRSLYAGTFARCPSLEEITIPAGCEIDPHWRG